MTSPDTVVELRGLGKDYGPRKAVGSVDLAIRAGEVFGLLGPNGAGKTTTISMLCGVTPPTRGRATVAGHDVVRDAFAARRAIGLVPQDLALYEELTPRQNLRFFGALYGLGGAHLEARIARALDIAQLADRADDLVKSFSGGMKRRLNLVLGLLHEPALLVLDEPTVGVDPQSRHHIFEAIRALRAGGMTVVYTSHYMEEVEELCDRVAIMDGGEVVAAGTLAELANRDAAAELEVAGDPAALAAATTALAALGAAADPDEPAGTRFKLPPPASWSAVVAAVEGAGARVVRLGARRADLETVFLALTGRGLRDA